ncbi:MAG: hypothetical protein FVQ76_12670 [Nitrospira sp.]|nr:hypothetical protein [Nitrospira sp.]
MTIATGATPPVTLDVGVHTITLTVTDNEGASASDTVVVTVGAGALVAGVEFRVNDDITFNQGSPNVAVLNDGNFVIAYAGNNADANMHGVVARLYDPAGNPLTDEFIVNTGVADDQYAPSVSALDDGGFVVTWTSNLQDGSGLGVYGQRYDALANPVGAEFWVNTTTQRSQASSEVATLADGGFVVTWNSWFQDGNKWGVYGQRFDDQGAPVGGEFQANMVTSRDQAVPQVAALTDGGFVLVWHSDRQDGSSYAIIGRRYDALGNPVADEFQINSFTSGFQGYPHVTALADSGFVVTWHSDGQDGSGWGVYGRRYDGAGDPAGGEFRVNPDTLNHQAGTRMTTLTDGGFVVAWGAFDGSLWRTFARRYTADGVAMGDKFQISDATNTAGLRPRLAPTPDGGFVITWHSPDGDEKGAFARVFAPGTGGGAASVTSLDTPQGSHPGRGLGTRGDFANK